MIPTVKTISLTVTKLCVNELLFIATKVYFPVFLSVIHDYTPWLIL